MPAPHDPAPPATTHQPNRGRRRLLGWASGILATLAAGAVSVPLVGTFFSILFRKKPDVWVKLGPVDDYPTGQTRLVDFRHPHTLPWDGEVGWGSAYVRRTADDFLVFSVHCTHLGCPVSWFPESGLFMCPCHGGIYYEDGGRASGPPPRGLFRFRHEVRGGHLYILAGHTPTLQQPLS